MVSEIPSSQQMFGPRYTVRSNLILDAIDNLIKPKYKIIDLASGIGSISLELCVRGYEVTLVERNTDAIEKSMMLIQREGFHAEYVNKDIFEYYPKIKADVVIASEILEHIDDEKALRHIRSNVIKTGGFLIVTVPSSNKFKELPSNPIGHLRLYDKNYSERILYKTGFKVKKIKYYGGFFLSLYMKLIDKKIKKSYIKENKILNDNWFNLYKTIFSIVSIFFKIDNFLFCGFCKNVGIVAIAEAEDK